MMILKKLMDYGEYDIWYQDEVHFYRRTLITNECDRFNFETIIKSVKLFLKSLAGDTKILVALDNASWHKKAVRLTSADTDHARIEFLFLPPYSPELDSSEL